MRSNIFIRFISIKWLNDDELLLLYKKGFGYLQPLTPHKLIIVDILLPLTNVCLNNDIHLE